MRRAWSRVAAATFAVGWGANQFSALLVAYRDERGISTATNDALFGIYAVSLVIALLLGGPAADRWGRARVVRPAAVVSLLASVLLMAGATHLGLLFAGRFAAGLASGAAFAAGTAWIKELSGPPYDPTAGAGAGARRAALSLSLGFGVGPLATGVLGQWAPHPLVLAYVPHLVLAAAVLPGLWRTPETRPGQASGGFAARLRISGVGHPRFLRVVLPAAVWVFAAPSLAIAVLPSLVSAHLDGYAIVFGGVAAALTLGAGVLIQPLAHRLDRRRPVTGQLLGLAATAAGAVVAAGAAASGRPALALLAAVVLGGGYGLGLVSGLLETQRLAEPHQLAGLTAVYYALTYAGFVAPVVLGQLARVTSYPVLLLALAALALLTLLAAGRPARA